MKLPSLGEIKKFLAALPGACVAVVSTFALTGETRSIVTTIGIAAGLLGTYFIGPNDPPAVAQVAASRLEAVAPSTNVSQGTPGTPGT
jgi:hypothetical protein